MSHEIKNIQFNRLQWSSSGEVEMVVQLKEEFLILGKKSEKLQILVGFLKIWLFRKIQQEYKAANYMIQAALKLVVKRSFVKQKCKIRPYAASCNCWNGGGISYLRKSQENLARDKRLLFFQPRGQEEWSSEITDIV